MIIVVFQPSHATFCGVVIQDIFKFDTFQQIGNNVYSSLYYVTIILNKRYCYYN